MLRPVRDCMDRLLESPLAEDDILGASGRVFKTRSGSVGRDCRVMETVRARAKAKAEDCITSGFSLPPDVSPTDVELEMETEMETG